MIVKEKAYFTEESESCGTSELPGEEETGWRFPFTATPFSPVFCLVVDIVDSLWINVFG